MTPSIAVTSAGKARLFEHRDVRVRAGALGARSAGQFQRHDVAEAVMPAPVVLATFAETKVARALARGSLYGSMRTIPRRRAVFLALPTLLDARAQQRLVGAAQGGFQRFVALAHCPTQREGGRHRGRGCS